MGLEEIEVERLRDGESGLQAGVEREIRGVCVRGENGENRSAIQEEEEENYV